MASETLIELRLPHIDPGAPMPTVLATEDIFLVGYRTSASDGHLTSTAILRSETCLAHTFGPPNDETLEGHRLSPLGLKPNAAFELCNSAWIAELENRNRVHPQHKPSLFAKYRHYVLTFHDSCLEFVAQDYDVTRMAMPPGRLAGQLVDMLR